MGAPGAKAAPRYGSPTQNKFSKSVQSAATPGDPAKKGMLQTNRNVSMGPRSTSALSSTGFVAEDDAANGIARPRELGRTPSVSRSRGPSRQATGQDEEIERLRAELADRNRQLKEQTATLVDMESSLTEVQTLMEQAEMPPPPRRGSLDDRDTAQLRSLVREKNERIAMLTAEFDAHRADFRSTIDTLELASTETERVYEKRIEELMQDIQQIQDRTTDVDVVATQLKQLEELVQELEEGLEDARRGEAEARGEVEFLRGEVERTRAELRREREKAASTSTNGTQGSSNGDQSALFKELEQKEDEIRGLKAIIHSLSRDSVPGDSDRPAGHPDDTLAREKLEREVAELRALLDTKSSHEEELEHELESLRRGSAATMKGVNRSSVRDSRDTVVLAKESEGRVASWPMEQQPSQQRKAHTRVRTLDTMPESDGVSSVTEQSAVWCELCESSGHDILTCTNMFGNQIPADADADADADANANADETPRPKDKDDYLSPTQEYDPFKVAPLSPRLPPASFGGPPPAAAAPPAPVAPAIKSPPPNMLEPGPVAGKESGIIDPEAWCALCEKDGHNSVDCPFEDAF